MKQLFSIKIVALIFSLFLVSKVNGQNLKDIRINEIQVHNEDGYKDHFGDALPWIELFNTGYGTVNVGGGILKTKGGEYIIPKTKEMNIPPRSYLIFYSDGQTQKGPFYTNFRIDESDFVEFYDPDDRTKPIDRLVYNPADMKVDATYGWLEDQDGAETLVQLPVSTPGANNNTIETIHRSELFRQADSSGIVLSLTAVSVVLFSLFLLYLIFKYMGKFNIRMANRKEEKAKEATAQVSAEPKAKGKKESSVLTNEEIAAIAIALYKYSEDLHDIEDTVLTINRAAKAYSPWSSKIYGLRQSLIKR